MGCDINIYRERKVNGSWETSTTETVEHYGDGDEYTSISNGIDSFEEGATRYVGRNYVLFSFLSGVRSYGETWFMDPIAEDRGFPEDICDVNKHLLGIDPESHPFTVLKMTVQKSAAYVEIEDGNDYVLAQQFVAYTDFPLASIMLYGCWSEREWALMLPSEY